MRPFSLFRASVLGLVLALGLTACDTADPDPPAASLDAVIAARGDLSILATALNATELDAVLRDPSGEFTVFAPTDAAFAALLEALELTPEQLLALDGIDGVLLFHVVPGTVRSTDLAPGQTVTTARAEGQATFTVVAAAGGLGIDVTGDGQADARITVTDIEAANGVVHVIDAVLVPTDFLEEEPTRNLAELVGDREDLSVLATALGATGLDAALTAEGPFTVFAPTDAAFVALLEALELTSEQLLALDGIDGVLLFHVAGAQILAADVAPGQTVTTLRASGQTTFTVVAANGGLGIDVTGDGQADARIVETDLRATNGVVHVIDAVLVPTDFLD